MFEIRWFKPTYIYDVKEMSSKDLYEVLGISRTATQEEITRAYRDLSKLYHPDKPTGDAEKFKEINNANSILSDKQKREMYDLTGSTNENAPPSMNMGHGGMPFGFSPFGPGFHMNVDINDLFGMFSRGKSSNPHRKVKRAKGPNKVHEMPLSLKDFYDGKKVMMNVNRQVFCSDCQGEGCRNWKTCAECKGSGEKETILQMGPGMMAVNRGPCGGCGGAGRMKGATCESCSGKGLLTMSKELLIEVKPGSLPGTVIPFDEMCSDHPDFEKPGDIHIRLVAADEDLDVEREGQNLRAQFSISLKEALVGCKRIIKDHPGGEVEITIPAGTMNEEVLTVSGKGMTIDSNLFVNISVIVSSEERKALEINQAILQSMF